MKRLLGLLAFAAILTVGMAPLTFAAEPMAAPGEMAAPHSQAIKGDLLRIDGEFYVVKEPSGKEVRLHVDGTSKLQGTFKAGDKIEAQASDKGHALSIKPAGAASRMPE
jgi:signal peptidase I